jgi:tetratricopeptide (TPR) repeat protein
MRQKAKEDLEREAGERRDADFWFYLATFRFSDEDRAGAIEALKKSIEMRPSNAAAILLQADWADWAGDPSLSAADALKKFEEAIRLDPHDFRGYVNRSSILFQKKDFDGAVRDLRAAISMDSDLAIAWQNLYVVGQATKNTDLMMEAAEAFIRIHPKTSQGLSMRADTYAARKDFSKMLEDLAAAAEKEPGNAFVRRRYGDALYHRMRLNEALAQFEACVKMDPENPKGYHGRAKVLLAMGEEEKALPDLERYAKAVPEDFAVWLDIARVRFTVGPLEQALPAIEHVLKQDPKNYDALSLKGDVYRALNEGQKSLDAYNEAVEIDETRPEARVGRAWVLQNHEYGAEALADLQYVLERYPKHEHARTLRARDHMVHKRWAEALRDIDAVIGTARQMKRDLERMRETCELNLNKKE